MVEKIDMPMGLAFQMATHQKAMENFGKMTDAEKRQVIEAARNTVTKQQMRNIVEDLERMS